MRSSHRHNFKLFVLSFERLRKGVFQNFGQISNMFIPVLAEVGMNSLTLLAFCGPLYFLNLLVTLGVYFAVTKRISEMRHSALAEQLKLDRDANHLISETFQNYFNVNMFGSRKLVRAQYASSIGRRIQVGGINGTHLANLTLAQRAVIMTGTLANLLLCVHHINKGVMTPGSIILLNNIMIQVFTPLTNLGQIYLRWQESFVEINDLLDIETIESAVKEKPDAAELRVAEGAIRFDHVDFSFGSGVSVR